MILMQRASSVFRVPEAWKTCCACDKYRLDITSKCHQIQGWRASWWPYYVETEVRGKKLQAIVDTRVDNMYMTKELADEISLPYKKEKGYIKGVNVKSLIIHGVARGTDIYVGPWRGKVDKTIAPLHNQKFYMGMDFLDTTKAVIVPHVSTLLITNNGQAHAISMRWKAEKRREGCYLPFNSRRVRR